MSATVIGDGVGWDRRLAALKNRVRELSPA